MHPALRPVFLVVFLVSAGCAHTTGAPKAPSVENDVRVLNARESFSWGEGAETVAARFISDELREQSRRILLRAEPGEDHWFGLDRNGSWFQFRFNKAGDLVVEAARNEKYQSSLFLEPPLRIGHEIMPVGERFVATSQFTATRGARRYNGAIEATVWFAGADSADTPMRRFEDTMRIDAVFRIELPFGLIVVIEQQQWLHPRYGEVLKTGIGSLRLLDTPVRTFRYREALIETRALPEDERDRLLMSALESRAKHVLAAKP